MLAIAFCTIFMLECWRTKQKKKDRYSILDIRSSILSCWTLGHIWWQLSNRVRINLGMPSSKAERWCCQTVLVKFFIHHFANRGFPSSKLKCFCLTISYNEPSIKRPFWIWKKPRRRKSWSSVEVTLGSQLLGYCSMGQQAIERTQLSSKANMKSSQSSPNVQ